MNKSTRKELGIMIDQLQDIQDKLEVIADEEQDKADNMPENMQMSEKHDTYEEISNNLHDASASIEDIKDLIQEAIEK
jgi:archaellum component FlaC